MEEVEPFVGLLRYCPPNSGGGHAGEVLGLLPADMVANLSEPGEPSVMEEVESFVGFLRYCPPNSGFGVPAGGAARVDLAAGPTCCVKLPLPVGTLEDLALPRP